MRKMKVRKGQIIQHRGDINHKIYRVVKGLLRSYTIDEKGKEHIFIFAPEDWVVADNLPPEEPCALFIDALEDSEVIVAEKNGLEKMDGDKMIRRLITLQQRVIRLLSSTAYERYVHFTQTYPQMVQRVPQKMIASYLGITPEALSKVKREHQRKS